MISKTIVINSYPRSASIFFLNTIYMIVGEKIHGVSIHVPILIGSKEVVTCTIIRNPEDCISSRIFQSLGNKRIQGSKIDKDFIDLQVEEYISYINAVNANKSYYSVFDSIISNPVQEAIKFLNNNSILVNQKSVKKVSSSNILNIIPYEKEGLYDGHYPRSVELNDYYIDIKNQVCTSPSIGKAKEAYLLMSESL